MTLRRFLTLPVWSHRLVFGLVFLGSLVSKDGQSDISRILMPSPSHCRVMSQDPSSQSRYPPPPEGDSIQVLPAVSFWKRERYRLSHRGRSHRTWSPALSPFLSCCRVRLFPMYSRLVVCRSSKAVATTCWSKECTKWPMMLTNTQ